MSLETRLVALVAAIGADIKTILSSLTGKNQSITVKDEGTDLVANPSAINFTGDGVAVSHNGGLVTVTVTASGGGGAQQCFVQPTAPEVAPGVPYLWVQTGLGSDGSGFTLWIGDGS